MSLPDDAALTARILAKTNEYLDIPSVVGHETPFLDHLERDFSALGLACHRPRNLCVVELGDGPVMLSHIDRHGGVVSAAGEVVYAAHAVRNEKYGEPASASVSFAGLVRNRYANEIMFAYDRRTGGRLAYGKVAGVSPAPAGHLTLDIAGLPQLPEGTPVSLARPLDLFEGSYVSGQLDNPVSAAVLRVAAEFGLRGTIVFTAEEEIGRSVEHFLAWADDSLTERADLLVLDTSPFDDAATALAGAVVLRRRDATASFNDTAITRLEQAAMTARVPVIFKDAFIEAENAARAARGEVAKTLGLTELGKIVAKSAGRFTGATLQLPTFNAHANNESTTPRALCAFARTLAAAAAH